MQKGDYDLSIGELLRAREIALALGAAHDAGLVHLDLKPANVILLAGAPPDAPRLKLIDFGAASAAGDGVVDDDAGLVGTPIYMSPEHARGQPADRRSDIYSLGVVLFEMLRGDPPFDQPTPRALLMAHISEAPPAVSSPDGPLPEALRRLVDRALRKNADERHQSAAEMVAEIDQALQALRRTDWLRWLPG